MARCTPIRHRAGWARRSVPVALASLAVCGTLHAQIATPDSFTIAARRLVTTPPASTRLERSVERRALDALYPTAGASALWSAAGAPTRQARDAIDALAAAGEDGLAPADYDPDALRALADSLARHGVDDAAVRARFDVLLSRSLVRFLADVHLGRVPSDSLGFRPDDHAAFDPAHLTRDASRSTDVAAVLATAEPPFAEYDPLKRALATYRALAADPTLRAPHATSRPLRPGDRYDDAPALRHLLMALGDLAASPDTSGGVYDSTLTAAVASYQRRHGLAPDGIIGAATMTELRTPLADRVRKIELSLERLRWLPERVPPRVIIVNVPAFQLYAFENDSTLRQPALTMRVIVGRARGRYGTPLLAATLRQVVFRPFWDVPLRIARHELVPQLRRDPGYALRDSFEIVARGDDSRRYPVDPQALDRVAAGSLRLRQRPGPDNSLGLIKFVFPNPYSVYLHGTPAHELFARSRRDFSHGCIRAEDPVALAELVLAGQDTWNRAAIETATNGDRTLTVDVARPFAVYVLYFTAVVGPDAAISFYPDLYGNDAALARTLGLPGRLR